MDEDEERTPSPISIRDGKVHIRQQRGDGSPSNFLLMKWNEALRFNNNLLYRNYIMFHRNRRDRNE